MMTDMNRSAVSLERRSAGKFIFTPSFSPSHRRYGNGFFSMPKTDSFYFGERSFLMRE